MSTIERLADSRADAKVRRASLSHFPALSRFWEGIEGKR
jgi:hypothetical protein